MTEIELIAMQDNIVTGKNSIVIGMGNNCRHDNCIIIGQNIESTGDCCIIIGNSTVQTSRVMSDDEFNDIRELLKIIVSVFH